MSENYKIIKCINQSEHNCIKNSGTWSIYSINYMFRPLQANLKMANVEAETCS
jgi:hypothetical protein